MMDSAKYKDGDGDGTTAYSGTRNSVTAQESRTEFNPDSVNNEDKRSSNCCSRIIGEKTEEKEQKESAPNSSGLEKDSNIDHIKYGAKHVIQLFVPVSICMVFVATVMNTVYAYQPQDSMLSLAITPFYKDSKMDTKNEGLNALYNALIIIGVVVVLTIILVVLYVLKCEKILIGWFVFATFCIMTVFVGFFIQDTFRALNTPLDWITFSFCIWNWSVVGMLSIYWKAPLILQQAYLIIDCAVLAMFFIRKLPNWTPWMLLGLIALWDLFAVLAPCGPLRILVEKAQERDDRLGASLVYTAGILFGAATESDKSDNNKEQNKKSPDSPGSEQSETEEENLDFEQESIRLGLGDFIFYSLLLGKASIEYDWPTTIACFVAILVGLAFTLILLSVVGKALPALPISIALGLIFYFATSQVISPFVNALAYKQLFI